MQVQPSWGNVTLVIAGLTNTYSSYITTYEEYQAQRYEGASTIFGPHTLDAYIQVGHVQSGLDQRKEKKKSMPLRIRLIRSQELYRAAQGSGSSTQRSVIKNKRKDYTFWRQFDEKPSVVPSCPGHSVITCTSTLCFP